MKLKYKYFCSGVIIFLFYIILKNRSFNFILQNYTSSIPLKNLKVKQALNKSLELEKEITLIIRYNRDLPKQITATVNSFLAVFPLIPILIVSDTIIPREVYNTFINASTIKNIVLKLDLLNLIVNRNVASHIKTKYVFVIPPGTTSFLKEEGFNLIKTLNKSKNNIIAVPVKQIGVKCLNLELRLLQWSIIYSLNDKSSECNSVKGDHGIFLNLETLLRMGEPFLLPFPESFYIQTTSLNFKTTLIYHIKLNIKEKYNQKLDKLYKNQIQRQILYKQFKIKKVTRENGVVEWYGCARNTQRCFPNVVNSIPEYLNQGRWTPPCCLRVLRQTVHHVFNTLKNCNVTFWLEGGSLLGAMRAQDIIPWDYDVDIGIYLKDIDKCPWLKMIHLGKFKKNQLPSVIDNEGYVWEKSHPEEGDFYRVQASVQNHLHVDIFPFFSKNGIMTKNTWFASHPQDKEFPEDYLIPLSTIQFAGIEAPAPNNIKEFLELKFGKDCVENPEYPNKKLFPFPSDVKNFLINETYNF